MKTSSNYRLFAILIFSFLHSLARISAQPLCIPGVQEAKPAKGSVDVSGFNAVCFNDASLQSVAEYLGKTWGKTPLQATLKKGTSPSTITLSLKADKKLGIEGYRLTIGKKGITVQAATPRGALWGVQTLLQMKATHSGKNEAGATSRGYLPALTITDKPDYPIRGMMLDVARKFYPMDYLYALVNVMSYYKMNCLQLHLNDNGFKDIFHGKWDETYSAFRMESDFFPGLTAIDGSYSKQEMRQFIRYAETMGVEIIPEIDAPAHCLAFTKFRPSLGSEEFGPDHLDLRNPDVVPFLDSLYAEFLGGPDPVFCGPRFHIGTDEYSNRDSTICERFRELIVHLCETTKRYGKQPVFWGSLTHAKGETPVPSDGVLMSLWYNGYADPVEMHKQGFHMISIPDGYVYIVPEAGYYYNYLNTKFLYQHWEPAQIGKERFAHADPLIDGGMFAVWNDIITNGISVGDTHDRILPAIQVVSEKCWRGQADTTDVAFGQWQTLASRLEDGPLADEIGRKSSIQLKELKPQSSLFNDDIPAGQKANAGNATAAANSSPFALHPSLIRQLGYPYTVSFTIDWADEAPGTVLLKSPRSTFYLADPVRGMLGFSRDGYLFTFKYRGHPGRRETLRIEGDNQGTTLYADGRLVERLAPDVVWKNEGKGTYKVMRTLLFPLQQTGAFRSKITDFSAKR